MCCPGNSDSRIEVFFLNKQVGIDMICVMGIDMHQRYDMICLRDMICVREDADFISQG